MKLERLAAIGEIISSVAIVVTLGYLAIQTKQTNNALMANSRQALLEAEYQFSNQILSNPDLLTLGYQGPKSQQEEARLVAHLVGLLRSREFVWMQFKYGVIDEETMRSYLAAAANYVSRPGNMAIWKTNKQFLDPRFVKYFEELLTEESGP